MGYEQALCGMLTTLRTSHPQHSQVAELVRRNQWGSNQQQLVYTGSNPVLTSKELALRGFRGVSSYICFITKDTISYVQRSHIRQQLS